jgi:predicted outer membrane repeat protein
MARFERAPRKRVVGVLIVALLCGMLLPAPDPSRAQTSISLYVAPGGNDSADCLSLATACATIDAAIGKAPGASQILIAPGAYRGLVRVDRNLSLIGAGADTTSTDGERDGVAVSVAPGVVATIVGLTIQGGFSSEGAGISNAGTLTLRESSVTDNLGGFGSAGTGGAGISNLGSLTVISTTVSANRFDIQTQGLGGGIYNAGSLSILGGLILNNSAGSPGGAGGGIFNAGSLLVERTTIQGNQAEQGGALHNSGVATLIGSSVNGNLAVGSFPQGSIALNTPGATLRISNSVFQGNSGSATGSILNSNGSLLVERSSFLDNQAANGGAIYGGGSITVDSSTFANNQAIGNDGGALFFSTGAMTVTNSTFFENRAAQQGGALVTGFGQNPNVVIRNSTFNGNAALGGNNVRKFGGRVTASNSIFADNSSVGSCVDLTSAGHNLSSDATCVGGPNDLADALPLLGPLQNNGGGTLTMLPLTDSPARDAGNDATCEARDQRGTARPLGLACDIGAVEAPAPPPPAVRLAFSQQPDGAQARERFEIGPVVVALDSRGRVAESFNGPVTMGLLASDVSGLLGGTLVVTASAGVATFGDLLIFSPGEYQLVARSGALDSATSAPFAVTQQPSDAPSFIPEIESNDVYTNANLLVLDAAGRAYRSGVISDAFDIDIFRFGAQAGSTITVELGSLPADYDVVLMADPDRTPADAVQDIDLASITDFGPRANSFGPRANSFGPRANSFGGAFKSGTANDSFTGYLPYEGTYYLAVYSASGASSLTDEYELSMRLSQGALVSPLVRAQALTGLNLTPDPSIRTLYLFDPARLLAAFPGTSAEIASLDTLLRTPALLGGSNGAILDPTAALQAGDLALLQQLYAQWDADPRQPLLANEVAQQLWYLLDRAIDDFYPNVTDIVLVGGDTVIPFYRIPDQNSVAQERQYFEVLQATGALAAGNTAFAGSLFFNYIKTDNFYADRDPTPFRGRLFALPDLGIGRLVETPAEIAAYLSTYTNGNFVIAAETPGAPGAGGVLVTGYDFAKDQAEELARIYGSYGFTPTGPLGTAPTLSTLISDTWGVNELNELWFSGQLPQLGPAYSVNNRYHLAALNGHFTHFDAEPAVRATGVISASRLFTPTAGTGTLPYFRVNGSPALIYSVGCQGGLNAEDSAFIGGSLLALDWPQAVLRQGGNWMSNTGFGYGDLDVVGYSERLSVIFTQALGRDLQVGGVYAGAPIGGSLALAKRQYLRELGGGTLDALHEKVLSTMTLYGLPFLRVKVPSPQNFDSLPPVPKLPGSPATFSRVITFTNSFDIATYGSGSAPIVTSMIEDGLRPSPITRTGILQVAEGRPVLPRVIYDVTVGEEPASAPVAQGVRLLSAEELPDLLGFAPKVTNVVTDDTYAEQAEGADLAERDEWTPELPYTLLRAPDTEVLTSTPRLVDQLIVTPAQLRALSTRSGTLRQFSQLVFEVTYVDPQAPAELRDDDEPPLLTDVSASLPQAGDFPTNTVRISAIATDEESGLESVSAVYSTDGRVWRLVALAPEGNDVYAASVQLGAAGRLELLVEARDRAGNVSTETGKGADSPYDTQVLSLITRVDSPPPSEGGNLLPPPLGKPDLVSRLSILPDKREFRPVEPVTFVVTVTNQGQRAAGEFWVDLYVQPSKPPNGANQLWSDRCLLRPCVGIAWYVPSGLGAGESITLRSDLNIAPAQSNWQGLLPPGTREIYVYADSFNPGVAYGGVDEANELNNAASLLGLRVRGE